MCFVKSFAGNLAHGFMAWFLCGSDICYNCCDGRKERRNCIFSHEQLQGIFLTYMQKMKNRLLRQGFVNAIKIVMKDMIKFGVIEIKENDCKTKCCVKQSYEKTKQ